MSSETVKKVLIKNPPRSSYKVNFMNPKSHSLFTNTSDNSFNHSMSTFFDFRQDYLMRDVDPFMEEEEYDAICLSGYSTNNSSGLSLNPIDAQSMFQGLGGVKLKVRIYGVQDLTIPWPLYEEETGGGVSIGGDASVAYDYIDIHPWAYPEFPADMSPISFASHLKCFRRNGIWYYRNVNSNLMSLLAGGSILQNLGSSLDFNNPSLMGQMNSSDYVGGNCSNRPSTKEEVLATFPAAASVINELMALAKEMSIDPGWIANSIAGESNFNHKAVNSKSGATGLIQFMPSTAKAYGTTTEKLYNMTAKQQWVYVRRYLIKAKGKVASQIDLSMRIFYPVSMGKPASFNIAEHWAKSGDRYKRYSGSTDEQKIQKAMDYFASVNGGIKTKADYYNKIIGKRKTKLPDRYC